MQIPEIPAQLLGLGMQIPEIPAQRKFVSLQTANVFLLFQKL